MAERKKQSLLNGAIILVISTLVVKVIGLCFKMPLGSMLGLVGYGYFTSVYAIYTPIYSISGVAHGRGGCRIKSLPRGAHDAKNGAQDIPSRRNRGHAAHGHYLHSICRVHLGYKKPARDDSRRPVDILLLLCLGLQRILRGSAQHDPDRHIAGHRGSRQACYRTCFCKAHHVLRRERL